MSRPNGCIVKTNLKSLIIRALLSFLHKNNSKRNLDNSFRISTISETSGEDGEIYPFFFWKLNVILKEANDKEIVVCSDTKVDAEQTKENKE